MTVNAIMIIYYVQLQLMKYTSLKWKKKKNLKMSPFVPLGHRSWDKVKSAWGLLGVNVSEDKRERKEDWTGKAFRMKCRAHKIWANRTGSSKARLAYWSSVLGRNGQCWYPNHPHSLGCVVWDLGSKGEANLAEDCQLIVLLADKQQVLSWREF